MLYGWYSAQQEKVLARDTFDNIGTIPYQTPSGKVVRVTCVTRTAEKPECKDSTWVFIFRGEVTESLGTLNMKNY